MSIDVPAAEPSRHLGRGAVAGAVGNAIEAFDWSIYAIFAVFFTEQFFPRSDPVSSLLATFAVFAIGFLARPIGSVLIGRVTDRIGRRAGMSLTVFLMAGASFGIALAPTAAAVGPWAAVVLIAMRLLQGLALGGEISAVGAYLVETAPHGHRGGFTSIHPSTFILGTLPAAALGASLSSWLSADEMRSFGWRIPFLIGGLLGVAGLFIRRGVHETLDLEAAQESRPIRAMLVDHPATTAIITIVVGALTLSLFGLLSGFPALAVLLGVSERDAFAANTAATLLTGLLIPLCGMASDRIGRRRTLCAGLAGLAVVAVPAIWLVQAGRAMESQLLISIPLAVAEAAFLVTLVEQLPARLRGVGLGLFWALAAAVFGGTAPFVSTWLCGQGMPQAFGWYVAVACGIAAVAASLLEETAFDELRA
jgi:MHS family alpha-ketoglutarate permease-like MFS transporter